MLDDPSKLAPAEETLAEALKSQVRSTSFWSTVAAIVGVVAVVAGGILYLSIEDIEGFSLTVLIIGAALLFGSLVLSPRGVAIFLVGRQARYGTNILIMAVAFFAIIVLVNFLFFRNFQRFDVTATRFFTLAPQTAQILSNLEVPVRANAFFVEGDIRRQQVEDILNEFARNSNNFEYRFVDPELRRAIALNYNVTQFPAIVIENLEVGTFQQVFPATEQQLVTGVLVVTGVERKKVYILTGHKERSATRDVATGDIEAIGFDLALEGLLRDNYAVQALNLLQVRSVPPDAAAVIVAGPEQDLDPEEYAALDGYLTAGGRMVVLLDPNSPPSFRDLLSEWGIRVSVETLADAGSSIAGRLLTPLLQRANGQYVSTELSGVGITSQIDVTFFPDATAIGATLPAEDIPPHTRFVPLALTTQASWLETDVDNPRPDPSVDIPGPYAVASVVEACAKIGDPPIRCLSSMPLTKLVAFGDSDFVSNEFFTSRDNADFFLNSVNYVTDDVDLISVRPKIFPVRELVLTSNERDFIQWSSWFLPPALLVLLGAWVWWRRR